MLAIFVQSNLICTIFSLIIFSITYIEFYYSKNNWRKIKQASLTFTNSKTCVSYVQYICLKLNYWAQLRFQTTNILIKLCLYLFLNYMILLLSTSEKPKIRPRKNIGVLYSYHSLGKVQYFLWLRQSFYLFWLSYFYMLSWNFIKTRTNKTVGKHLELFNFKLSMAFVKDQGKHRQPEKTRIKYSNIKS